MAANYPNSLPGLGTTRTDATTSPTTHKDDHNRANEEVNAIAAELGLLPKGSAASVRARLDVIQPPTPAAYTVTGSSADRTIDVTATTFDELLNVVATLIADLKARGILG